MLNFNNIYRPVTKLNAFLPEKGDAISHLVSLCFSELALMSSDVVTVCFLDLCVTVFSPFLPGLLRPLIADWM